ncbi:MAG: hypothetical protein ACOC1K_03205 [Nanoarchaeota archaeon]
MVLGEIKSKYNTITINGYKIETQYITVDKFMKLFSISISGEEPMSIKELNKKLEEIQEWGGEDSVKKELDKKINTDLPEFDMPTQKE